MLALHEDEFCMFACSRNCVTPRTAYVIVGWLGTRLEWGSVKSPNVAIIVTIWRVCYSLIAPLCVRRLIVLVVKDCV